MDQLASYLRWHWLQSAESDQQAERRAAEARVVVGNAGGSASADPSRSRRRDVSADARRRCASRRRHQRRLPVGVSRPRSQRRQRQRADHADAQHRHLRRQDLRNHRGRAPHRGQRENGRRGVGHAGDGSQAGLHVHRRCPGGERHHHLVSHRLPEIQERHVLHPRPRRANGERAVADLDDRAPRGTWRRYVGQPAADVPRGRRRVDDRQLRSRHQSRLLGHGAGEAVGAISARHCRRRALYEQHARTRPEDRKDAVVLPAHTR